MSHAEIASALLALHNIAWALGALYWAVLAFVIVFLLANISTK